MDEVEQRFWGYHERNPRVFHELRDIAVGLRNAGHTKWSIDGITEVLRWQRAIVTVDSSCPFKIANDYRPLYARLLMRDVPTLENFFDVRERPLAHADTRLP
jgi:hypothetical protein